MPHAENFESRLTVFDKIALELYSLYIYLILLPMIQPGCLKGLEGSGREYAPADLTMLW